MQNDTLEWLLTILKPFFVNIMLDPPHEQYTKVLPNPMTVFSAENLKFMNNQRNQASGGQVPSFGSNYFAKEEAAALQGKFADKLQELAQALLRAAEAPDFQPPASLLHYLKHKLLFCPDKAFLWPYELNRVKFSTMASSYLDKQATQNQELLMLSGMLVIAKFLVVKVLLSSGKYRQQLQGLEFSQAQYMNLKMVATVIYHTFKDFVETSVPLKQSDFQSDDDTGLTKLLFDQEMIFSYGLGEHGDATDSLVTDALVKLVSRMVHMAQPEIGQ